MTFYSKIMILVSLPGKQPSKHTDLVEENIMDCNGLAGSEGTLTRNRVSPLKCHGQLLKQICRLF